MNKLETFALNDKPLRVHHVATMQWEATSDTQLTFYEICTPSYQNGRFENLAS